MLEAFRQVNWLAVLAAGVAHLVLGGLWYTVLFRQRYAAVMGLDEWPARAPLRFILGPFVCGLVNIATTAILMRALGIATYGAALAFGGLVGAGYLGAMTVNIAINPLFPRPYAYALFTAPMFLIGSLLSCVILVALG